MTGTLRREVPATVNTFGDPVPASTELYTVEGIRDSFNVSFATLNGIPQTDMRILLIMNLISPPTTPKQDDKIFIRNSWHQVRRVVEIDPASASIVLQCFKIAAPS